MTGLLMAFIGLAAAEAPYIPTKQPFEEKVPFERYTTTDVLGRTITFYLSRTSTKDPLPLMLFIQGSGGQSIWNRVNGAIAGGLQLVALMAAERKARVLMVEKPGIPFAFEPKQFGSAEGAPKEFLEEHTLDRWAEANRAALLAALKLEKIAPGKVLVCGHSEGGLVASKVAADTPGVTHVASLAGGGPTQLYDFTQMMPQENLYKAWAEVMADPMSTEKFLFGHPYRRWSTFCSTSPAEQLSKFNGKIFIAQGTEDKAVAPNTFDILLAELRAKGKKVEAVKVEKGDHGFRVAGNKEDGFNAMVGRVVRWFHEG